MDGAWSIGLIGGVSLIGFGCGGGLKPGIGVKTGSFFFLGPLDSCMTFRDESRPVGDRRTGPADATLESFGGIFDNLRVGDSATEARKSGPAKNVTGEVPASGDRGKKGRDALAIEGLSVFGLPTRLVALKDLL